MTPRLLLLSALLLASPALAQEGENAGKAAPQEEAFASCSAQVEQQSLPSDEQKKQWMMHCLTGVTGKGPSPRAIPAEQQQKICEEQRDELELAGGEADTFVKACVDRNAALLNKSGG